MERYTINLYAKDRFKPTVAVTYTLNSDGEFSMLKFWVRQDKQADYDIMNVANLLFYSVYYSSNKKPSIIYSSYQYLFAKKMWENHETVIETFRVDKHCKLPPNRRFVEFNKNSMSNLIQIKTNELLNQKQKGDIKNE